MRKALSVLVLLALTFRSLFVHDDLVFGRLAATTPGLVFTSLPSTPPSQ